MSGLAWSRNVAGKLLGLRGGGREEVGSTHILPNCQEIAGEISGQEVAAKKMCL
jgi:hypothetical protein